MSRDPINATLPFDPHQALSRPRAALPFAGRDSEAAIANVARAYLEAPAGAPAVPIALETLPWRHDGALRLTVIVKATFSMASSPMPPAERPEPFHAHDVHHKNQPMAHVAAASDRAPWKMRADVTVLGHARAPAGRSVPEMTARFALLASGQPLIDKTLRVVGDRDDADASPKPFAVMPIRWERAHGGSAVAANPIGCSGEDDDLPNILDPHNAWRPAGLGPISAAWPLRHRRLRDTPRKALDAPIVDLPREVDWSYFQSAPADQQITELPADGTLVLEGFDADRPRLEIALPGAQAVGAVYGLDEADPDAPAPLPFHADTLHVDVDQRLCTIAFRACLDLTGVSAAAVLGRLLVAAGVGVGESLPAVPERRPRAAPAGGTAPSFRPPHPATGTLEVSSAPPRPPITLPFQKGGAAPADDSGATLALPPSTPSPAAAHPWAHPASQGHARVPVAQASAPVAQASPPVAQASPPVAYASAPVAQASPPVVYASAPVPAMSAPVPLPPEPGVPAAAPAEPELLTPVVLEPQGPLPPEEEVDLERYAEVCAALDEPGGRKRKAEILEARSIAPETWKQAEQHWRKALEQEMKRGERAHQERFDDAYVGAWEALHPGKVGPAEAARLLDAAKRGLLASEMGTLGVPAALGTRLHRVWKRRAANDDAVRTALEAAAQRAG